MKKQDKRVLFIIIDLFAGAGGVTTGFALAKLFGVDIAKVIYCINHDSIALESHAANHPDCIHAAEDIRTAAFAPIVRHLKKMKKQYPNAKVILWASAECTNLSNAKGGMSRDPDSRTLSENLYLRWDHKKKDFVKNSYIQQLDPDYVMVENVREIMAWGPMVEKVNLNHKFEGYPAPISYLHYDKKKKYFTPHWTPEDRNKGKDYQRWVREICDLGYRHEHRLLNAADFGAYTSRLRYFGIFAKHGLPIVWPQATHSKKVTTGMFGGLAPWKPVREVLDLDDEGHSIFTRKINMALRPQDRHDLEEKTLERIYAGLIKHVAGGEDAFLVKHMGNNEHTGINNGKSLNEPCITIACQPRLCLATPLFLSKYYGGKPESRNTSLSVPCSTVTTENRMGIVSANFISKNYSGEPEHKNITIDGPAGSITTADSQALVSTNFLTQRNGGNPDERFVSIDGPARTITGTGGNQDLVSAKFLLKYYGTGVTHSLDKPADTITTKDRMGLAKIEFLDQQYGNSEPASIEEPANTITANPKLNLVQAEQFISSYYSGGSKSSSLDSPAIALTTIPKHRLITVETSEGFLDNPGWHGHQTGLNAPAPTIVARQDKAPMSVVQCLMTNQHNNKTKSLDEPAPTLLTGNHHYLLNAQFNNPLKTPEDTAPTITADRHWPYLVATEEGHLVIQIYESDSPATRKIKQFMAAYGIVDIKMRMLKVVELKLIQGFPKDYILRGGSTKAKKHIGNSVVPIIPQRMAEALGQVLLQHTGINFSTFN